LSESDTRVLPWPAKSLDLNPIENLWSWIDDKLSFIQIHSIDHLKEVIHQLWMEVTNEHVENLIKSMKKRVLACYKAK
jgi:hypothetical protein